MFICQLKKGHAKSVAIRKGGNYIRSYEIDYLDMCDKLKVLRFKGASVSWVKYIILNRTNAFYEEDYDLVIGPTADAEAQSIIEDFIRKNKNPSEDDFIKLSCLLKPKVFPDQICLKSEKAIRYFNKRLKCIERF